MPCTVHGLQNGFQDEWKRCNYFFKESLTHVQTRAQYNFSRVPAIMTVYDEKWQAKPPAWQSFQSYWEHDIMLHQQFYIV